MSHLLKRIVEPLKSKTKKPIVVESQRPKYYTLTRKEISLTPEQERTISSIVFTISELAKNDTRYSRPKSVNSIARALHEITNNGLNASHLLQQIASHHKLTTYTQKEIITEIVNLLAQMR